MPRSGIPWSLLPPQFGVRGMTCRRRLRGRKKAGVWERARALLLAELDAAGRLEPRVGLADSTGLRATKRGEATGPDPTDCGNSGSKQHLLADPDGTQSACDVTAANAAGGTQVITAPRPIMSVMLI